MIEWRWIHEPLCFDQLMEHPRKRYVDHAIGWLYDEARRVFLYRHSTFTWPDSTNPPEFDGNPEAILEIARDNAYYGSPAPIVRVGEWVDAVHAYELGQANDRSDE